MILGYLIMWKIVDSRTLVFSTIIGIQANIIDCWSKNKYEEFSAIFSKKLGYLIHTLDYFQENAKILGYMIL